MFWEQQGNPSTCCPAASRNLCFTCQGARSCETNLSLLRMFPLRTSKLKVTIEGAAMLTLRVTNLNTRLYSIGTEWKAHMHVLFMLKQNHIKNTSAILFRYKFCSFNSCFHLQALVEDLRNCSVRFFYFL